MPELLKDLVFSTNVYDIFDNRPPTPEFDTNDVGILLPIGWTYWSLS